MCREILQTNPGIRNILNFTVTIAAAIWDFVRVAGRFLNVILSRFFCCNRSAAGNVFGAIIVSCSCQ